MGFFSEVTHRVTHVAQQIHQFHQGAANQVGGDATQVAANNANLASDVNAANRTIATAPYKYANEHNPALFEKARNFVFFQGKLGGQVRNDIRKTVGNPAKRWWNHWGDEVHVIVQKWGGEQRLTSWGVVVVCVIVIIYTWGAATPYVMAIAGPMMSYGVAGALAPRNAASGGDLSLKIDNSKYNAQNDTLGGAGSGQSPAGGVADFLAGHPLAVAGAVLAAAGIGLFFLLRR